MTDPSLHRDLGKVEGRLEAVENDTSEIRSDMKEIHIMLRAINAQLDAAGGSWKFMLGIAGAASALTAVMMNVKRVLGME